MDREEIIANIFVLANASDAERKRAYPKLKQLQICDLKRQRDGLIAALPFSSAVNSAHLGYN